MGNECKIVVKHIDNTINSVFARKNNTGITKQCNDITKIISMSSNIEYLDLSMNILTELPEFTVNLKELWLAHNYIEELYTLSEGLKVLSLAGNPLSKLPKLPESLEYLNITGTLIEELPELPKNLSTLICAYTPLKHYSVELPNSIRTLVTTSMFKTNHLKEVRIKFMLDN